MVCVFICVCVCGIRVSECSVCVVYVSVCGVCTVSECSVCVVRVCGVSVAVCVCVHGMCECVCSPLHPISDQSPHRPFLAGSHALHVSEGKVEGGWVVNWKHRWSSQGNELGNADWLGQ